MVVHFIWIFRVKMKICRGGEKTHRFHRRRTQEVTLINFLHLCPDLGRTSKANSKKGSVPLMTQPAKVHTQFKREPINAGLTFMVIYSCFCTCFCTSTSTQERGERGWGRERGREEGGRRIERERESA